MRMRRALQVVDMLMVADRLEQTWSRVYGRRKAGSELLYGRFRAVTTKVGMGRVTFVMKPCS